MDRPVPGKRMSKVVVVFDTAFENMVDHSLAGRPTVALQVAPAEGVQKQLRLVEPRGVRWRQQYLNAWAQLIEAGLCVTTGVARSAVHDHVHPSRPIIGVQEAADRRSEVSPIVAVQTLGPHAPRIQGQAREQIDRAMAA